MPNSRLQRPLTQLSLCALFFSPSATHSQTINFLGGITNSCVLTISTPGVLAAETTGTTLSSEAAGGTSAILAVVALGTKPTIQFTAPSLSSAPVAYGGSPTVSLRYTSALGGASQAYTTSSSSYVSNTFLDTVTLNAKVVDSSGFNSGSYTVSTVATCQQ